MLLFCVVCQLLLLHLFLQKVEFQAWVWRDRSPPVSHHCNSSSFTHLMGSEDRCVLARFGGMSSWYSILFPQKYTDSKIVKVPLTFENLFSIIPKAQYGPIAYYFWEQYIAKAKLSQCIKHILSYKPAYARFRHFMSLKCIRPSVKYNFASL